MATILKRVGDVGREVVSSLGALHATTLPEGRRHQDHGLNLLLWLEASGATAVHRAFKRGRSPAGDSVNDNDDKGL
ncbi:hypothetical protein EYF80_054208 [Liparis tanakae]|uniref:Uncharacterized protein n=1 Tax=Liparis tanakae TaxID=230148 RepID=A0A4Z2F3A8_9TELE|nr:hypothetical protein EYF80_054208 [Liparis tanakae]